MSILINVGWGVGVLLLFLLLITLIQGIQYKRKMEHLNRKHIEKGLEKQYIQQSKPAPSEPPDMSDPVNRIIADELSRAGAVNRKTVIYESDKSYYLPPYLMEKK